MNTAPGTTVRYISDDGRWRFGTIIETGYKWAKLMVAGETKKVLIDNLQSWPPEKIDAPSKPAKRGRA
jgi:hypothetical protein